MSEDVRERVKIEQDTFIKWEIKGQTLVGVPGSCEKQDDYWTHTFIEEGKEEPIKFNASGLLHGLIKKAIKIYGIIEIIYEGRKPCQGNTKQSYHDYTVSGIVGTEHKTQS